MLNVVHSARMLAIDCEMCTTNDGLELARISVVDEAGAIIYDTFVVPDNPIVNYNTEYSGITAELLQG
jgi:RNA exonuclease 1